MNPGPDVDVPKLKNIAWSFFAWFDGYMIDNGHVQIKLNHISFILIYILLNLH